jgi:hypothetical protein
MMTMTVNRQRLLIVSRVIFNPEYVPFRGISDIQPVVLHTGYLEGEHTVLVPT